MEQFTDEERDSATTVKVCLMGDAGVGKSNIASQFAVNTFNEAYHSTIGVEFQTKLLRCTKNRQNIRKLQIWDTAGQERFRSITTSYVRGSHAMIFVYDVTERSSFEAIEANWLKTQRDHGSQNQAIFIVGNKTDLTKQRKVAPEEGETLAAKHQCHFMEISAKDGPESSTKLFQWMIDLLELPLEERKKILMLETEDTIWTNRMSGLLNNTELFRNYSGLMIYEPIVKLIVPGLLNKQVIDWIVVNSDILTPAVIQRLTTMAHIFSFEKKGLTDDNLVHLYLVSHACKFALLSSKVVECIVARKSLDIEEAIKNSPKLIGDASVIDLNEASTVLIDRVNHLRTNKEDLPLRTPISELWREMIGQLYNERDTTGDLTIIVNTRSCKAHKVILSFATPFFEPNNNNEVRIEKDISNSAWDVLLKYLYTHETKEITEPTMALEILSIASYLKLDSNNITFTPRDHSLPMQNCDTLVYESITIDSAIDRLVAAVSRADPVDKKITLRYCVSNYETLFNKYESRLAALPKEIMFLLMSRVIERETKHK